MLDIKRVVPTEDWELIAEYDNEDCRILEIKKIYDKGYSFLAYPNQLKAFIMERDKILWKNGKSLSFIDFYQVSSLVDIDNIRGKVLRIDYKNQAPTKEHDSHHWYGVYLYPFNILQPINLSESIAGGLADRGGSCSYSIEELIKANEWKNHFKLSGCEWAIPIIEQNYNNIEKLIDMLVDGICERSNFNE